jgi:hypothetical protein
MKKILLFLTILLTASNISFAQNRVVARGAEPGELYLTGMWYGTYDPPPFYDTLRIAVCRLTENGKKLTIQYDFDYFAYPGINMTLGPILADATPGVLYYKCYHFDTFLWISFDYGKNWEIRDESIGQSHYYPANFEGLIYRTGSDWSDGTFKSDDYATTFIKIDNNSMFISEPGFEECEFFSFALQELAHTYDCFQNHTTIMIDEEYVFGQMSQGFPDVYRGGLPGEVYISSWFPDNTYKVSFSADTGHTFRHVYISEAYPPGANNYYPIFMSDREPGVFYIIRRYIVEDTNPLGHHTIICIDYYRDYGEILEATFCHDLTKNYQYEEVTCNNTTYLDSEVVGLNSIRLQWSNSAGNIRGYHVFRNNARITSELLIDPTYLDENLPNGHYEYYVRTYYKEGCVSDSSNHVWETIYVAESCEAINDLASEKINDNSILLTWTEPEDDLQIEGYSIYKNNIPLTGELILEPTYLDENLPDGNYEYYVFTHYTNGCISDSSNHVIENIEVGINELEDRERVVLHPNPTNGELQVTSYKLQIEKIDIFDVYGRNVMSSKPLMPQQYIDISHLYAGIYFAKITTDKGRITKKIIKY